MALTIGELVGYLKLDDDQWTSKQRKAKRDLEDLSDQWGKTGSKADTAALGFLNAANSLSNIPTIVQVVAGVGQTLGALSGALGVVPGIAAAAAAGLAAVKLGVQGVGDAVNESDPKKLAEELKGLAPAARETVIALRGLHDEWSGMQRSVQQELFAGLAGQMKSLGHNYIPVLKDGLSGVAAGLNEGARATTAYLNRSTQVSTVAGIFKNVRAATDEVGKSMSPLAQIILDITSVSSEFLPNLVGGLSSAAEKAADFVNNARETGQLKQWISTGLSTLGDLWQVLKNIGSIVKTVFDAFSTGGSSLLDTLLKVTGSVKDFLKSFEGQQALKALASALGTVSSVVTDVMLTAFRELAPVIVAAAPGFAELARQVGSVLVSALQIVGPLLTGLAGFLSDNIEWLGPLAIAVYGGVKAFEALTATMRIVNLVSSVNPWIAIAAATIALATLIVTHWDTITAAIGAAWKWLTDRAAEVWGWIKQNIIDNIVAAAKWVGDKVQDILNFFGWLASLPGKALEWFGGVLQAAKDKIGEVIQWFKDLPRKILEAIGDFAKLLYNAGRDLLIGLWDGIKSMIETLTTRIKNFAHDMVEAMYEALGIHSPSRVFREIGVFLGQGLIDGIDGITPKVLDSVARLSKAATIDVNPLGSASWLDIPRPTLDGALAGAGTAGSPGTSPFAASGEQRALVSIGTFVAGKDQSPHEIASDLDWMSRGGGY